MARPRLDPRWNSPKALASAIGALAPFKAWPLPALLRLAQAAAVSSHPPGVTLIERARSTDVLSIFLEGSTQASITDASGRCVTFVYDASTMVYGLAPLFDGGEIPHDLIAVDNVAVLRIPFAAARAELSAAPQLWRSLGIEMCACYRRTTAQMTRFVFDAPRVHMAALLVGLADKGSGSDNDSPITIDMRLSQEKLAEMLAISRQWAAQLLQEMGRNGLVRWRYGRVTLLDMKRLRTLAGESISLP